MSEQEQKKIEIELTEPITMDSRQIEMMLLHPVLNIMNVIQGNLALLTNDSSTPSAEKDLWMVGQLFVDELKQGLSADQKCWERYFSAFDRLYQLLMMGDGEGHKGTYAGETFQILQLLRARSEQKFNQLLVYRQSKTPCWQIIEKQQLQQWIVGFLDDMAKNSRGRFGVIFSAGQSRGPHQYLVEICFLSPEEATIALPDQLWDTIQDLIANARKYTPPGGEIKLILGRSEGALLLVVQDSGRGIPVEEISSVVKFGYRASNVGKQESSGGGFGLTRAYFLCRQLEGRMWIGSAPTHGTTVTMLIPLPQ